MVPKIHIVRTADGADFPLPSYTSKHHFALNLMAAISAPIKIGPRERVKVPTGFAIALPDGLCGQVISNREMAHNHGIIVLDAPSLIHPADREALFIVLRNESNQQFILQRGMKIAQLLLIPAIQTAWQEIKTDLDNQNTNAHLSEVVVEAAGDEEKPPYLSASDKRPKVSIRERSSK